MTDNSGEIRASDAEREAVVEQLNTAVGEGRLTLAEFSDRVSTANAAQTRTELDRLLVDLPAGVQPRSDRAPAPVPVRQDGGGHTDWHVSPIGGVKRGGRWQVAQRTVSVTLIGGLNLDLRDAELAAPAVTITSVTILGGANLVVPPGVRVELSGFSLLGGRTVDVDDADLPNAPILRVRVFSILGGTTVRSTTPIQRLRRRFGK